MGFGRWPLRIVRGSGGDLYIVIDDATKELAYKFIDTTVGEFAKYRYLEYYIAGGGGAGGRGAESDTYIRNGATDDFTINNYYITSSVSSNNKIFRAGGYVNANDFTDLISIYNDTPPYSLFGTSTLYNRTGSTGQAFVACTSSNNRVFFGGGIRSNTTHDMITSFNASLNNMTNMEASKILLTLSIKRGKIGATSSNSKVFFAGGFNSSTKYNTVDIFDATQTTQTNMQNSRITVTLSVARDDVAATSSNSKVFFAGGSTSANVSNVIDIFDATKTTQTNMQNSRITVTLSSARRGIGATSSNNKVFFGGGSDINNNLFDTVDIFDATQTTQKTIQDSRITVTLSSSRTYISATSGNNRIFFGSGLVISGSISYRVDIFDSSKTTQTDIQDSLSTVTLSTMAHDTLCFSNNRVFVIGRSSTTANVLISTNVYVGGGGGGSGFQNGYITNIPSSKTYSLSANQPPAETRIDLSENRIVRIETSLGTGAAIGDVSGQPTILRLWANDNTLYRRIDASGGFSGTNGTASAGAGGAGFFGGGGGAGGIDATDTASGGASQVTGVGYAGSASTETVSGTNTTYTSGAGAGPGSSTAGGGSVSLTPATANKAKVAVGGGGGGGNYLGSTPASGASYNGVPATPTTTAAGSGSDYTSQGGGGGASSTLNPGTGGKGFAILRFSN
jgi:hypothetical protein